MKLSIRRKMAQVAKLWAAEDAIAKLRGMVI